jgi:uncharacterized damage-inducible protein DinB
MSAQLERMLRYDVWANGETLRSLRQSGAPARSLRWMGHILGAEVVWLSRMEGRPSPLPVWPDLSPAECEARYQDLSRQLTRSLTEPWANPLNRPVSYTNTKGERWTSTVDEILTHVVIHSAYHRGQIASDLRAAGLEPTYTDYIHAVRQGVLE